MTAQLRLQLLGMFKALDQGGAELVISARKGRGLLALLALAPQGTLTRERLAGLLWSDRGEDQARSSLRQGLTVLRKELGAAQALLSATEERVSLDPRLVEIDALRLVSLARSHNRDELRKAVALYRGPLLEDAAINDPAFEEWLGEERRRLAEIMTGCVGRLIALESGEARIAAARLLLSLDPLREASHLELMKALAEAGQRSAALQHYASAAGLLKAELGITPGAAIEALRQDLLSVEPAPVAVIGTSPVSGAVKDERPSIAVLPFANLSGDQSHQYLSDGITEDIIIQLSRYHELRTLSRASSFRLGGADIDPEEASARLGAQFIVTGSVRRSGLRLLVSCQLLNGATGHVLWSERYDRSADDVFAVQDEVVAKLATTVGGRLMAAEANLSRQKPTASWSAYDYYLRGRELTNAFKEYEAEAYFSRAVEIDPGFGLAHAWRTIAFISQSWYTEDKSLRRLAEDLANAALAIDGNEAMAHWAAALAHGYQYRPERAMFHFERAMQLNPLEVNIRADYADRLVNDGRVEDSYRVISAVLAEDPFAPVWIYMIHGKILYHLGRYGEAVRVLDNKLIDNFMTLGHLAASHAMLGNEAEAQRAVAQMIASHPAVSLQSLRDNQCYGDLRVFEHLAEGLKKAGFNR